MPCLPQVNLEMAVLLRWMSVQVLWQESAKDTESLGVGFMCLAEQMLPCVVCWKCFLRNSALALLGECKLSVQVRFT